MSMLIRFSALFFMSSLALAESLPSPGIYAYPPMGQQSAQFQPAVQNQSPSTMPVAGGRVTPMSPAAGNATPYAPQGAQQVMETPRDMVYAPVQPVDAFDGLAPKDAREAAIADKAFGDGFRKGLDQGRDYAMSYAREEMRKLIGRLNFLAAMNEGVVIPPMLMIVDRPTKVSADGREMVVGQRVYRIVEQARLTDNPSRWESLVLPDDMTSSSGVVKPLEVSPAVLEDVDHAKAANSVVVPKTRVQPIQYEKKSYPSR